MLCILVLYVVSYIIFSSRDSEIKFTVDNTICNKLVLQVGVNPYARENIRLGNLDNSQEYILKLNLSFKAKSNHEKYCFKWVFHLSAFSLLSKHLKNEAQEIENKEQARKRNLEHIKIIK